MRGKIADMRHRIRIERATLIKDERGNTLEIYTDAGETWAAIWPQATSAGAEGKAIVHETIYKIIMRWREISIKDRFVFKERVFEQVQPPIDRDFKSETLECICREVLSHGEK